MENPYKKWKRERELKRAVDGMSELGKELLDALLHVRRGTRVLALDLCQRGAGHLITRDAPLHQRRLCSGNVGPLDQVGPFHR